MSLVGPRPPRPAFAPRLPSRACPATPSALRARAPVSPASPRLRRRVPTRRRPRKLGAYDLAYIGQTGSPWLEPPALLAAHRASPCQLARRVSRSGVPPGPAQRLYRRGKHQRRPRCAPGPRRNGDSVHGAPQLHHRLVAPPHAPQQEAAVEQEPSAAARAPARRGRRRRPPRTAAPPTQDVATEGQRLDGAGLEAMGARQRLHPAGDETAGDVPAPPSICTCTARTVAPHSRRAPMRQLCARSSRAIAARRARRRRPANGPRRRRPPHRALRSPAPPRIPRPLRRATRKATGPNRLTGSRRPRRSARATAPPAANPRPAPSQPDCRCEPRGAAPSTAPRRAPERARRGSAPT